MIYVGESSRSSNERGGEHKSDFHKQKTDSHQYKHVQTEHAGQLPPPFEFRVVAKFNSALTRQISEAVMIRRREGRILNSKGVYNRCRLPRLTLEDQPKQDRNEEKQKFEIPELENWQKQENRRKRKNDARQSQAKKAKIDPEVAKQPRQVGYKKRKSFENRNEFESVCKRLRPEFNPEEEYECQQQGVSQAVREAETLKSKSKPIIFFSVFSKTNKDLNNKVMFKPSAKLKAIQNQRKKKKKVEQSLTSKGGSNQSIKDYFKIIDSPREEEKSARGQLGGGVV